MSKNHNILNKLDHRIIVVVILFVKLLTYTHILSFNKNRIFIIIIISFLLYKLS